MKQRKCFEIHSLQQPHDIYPSNLSKSTMNQQSLSSACQRLKAHDETLTLLNLSKERQSRQQSFSIPLPAGSSLVGG
jgi:hypothetical protein